MQNILSVSSQVALYSILLVAMCVCLLALGVAWIYSVVIKINVWWTYRKYNKINTVQNIDAKTNAEYLLKSNNVNDVKVEKCSWFRGLLGLGMTGWGNSYSPRRKTIFLRKNIIDKATITSIGVSSQRVGQAIMDKDDDKKLKTLNKLRPFYMFGPVLFLPIILVFSLLDLFVFKTSGLVAIVSVLFAFLYLVGAFVCLLITIPVEKRANQLALNALKESGMYTESELSAMQVVLNSYIKSYIADFIYAIVQISWEILKLIAKLCVKKK